MRLFLRKVAFGFQILTLIGGFACALLAIAGLRFYQADSITIAAPYWLGGGILLLGMSAWFERRHPRLRRFCTVLLVIFLGLATFLLAPLWSGSAAPARADGPSFRLISFNMYKDNPDPAAAVHWLSDQHADLMVLSEVSPANEKALAKLRGQFPYVYGCADPGWCSTRIYSRRPAVVIWPLARGDPENRQALSAITAHFRFGDTVVPLTAVHLQHPWPLGYQHRTLAELSEALTTIGRGGLLTGDFNSSPWTHAMRGLARAGDMLLGTGARLTWPVGKNSEPFLPLDQLYLGPCFRLTSLSLGPELGSDHLPILADVATTRCHD